MQPIWIYACENPECFSAFVRASKIPATTKQICHACGEPLPEKRLYIPRSKHQSVPAKAFGGSE